MFLATASFDTKVRYSIRSTNKHIPSDSWDVPVVRLLPVAGHGHGNGHIHDFRHVVAAGPAARWNSAGGRHGTDAQCGRRAHHQPGAGRRRQLHRPEGHPAAAGRSAGVRRSVRAPALRVLHDGQPGPEDAVQPGGARELPQQQ